RGPGGPSISPDTLVLFGSGQFVDGFTLGGVLKTVLITGQASLGSESFQSISGDLLIDGGSATFSMGSFSTMDVQNLRTLNGGLLNMMGSLVTMDVAAGAEFAGGDESGHLTSGKLVLHGDLVQHNGHPYAFQADAGHTTELAPTVPVQSLFFQNP